MKRRVALFAPAVLLAGCASPDVNEYAGEQPPLDLRTYFNGKVEGTGLFADRSGKVVKRFQVLMDCRWNGDAGVLDEDFTYSDGSKQRRVWSLSRPLRCQTAQSYECWAHRQCSCCPD